MQTAWTLADKTDSGIVVQLQVDGKSPCSSMTVSTLSSRSYPAWPVLQIWFLRYTHISYPNWSCFHGKSDIVGLGKAIQHQAPQQKNMPAGRGGTLLKVCYFRSEEPWEIIPNHSSLHDVWKVEPTKCCHFQRTFHNVIRILARLLLHQKKTCHCHGLGFSKKNAPVLRI